MLSVHSSAPAIELYADVLTTICAATVAAGTTETGGSLAGAVTPHGNTPVLFVGTVSQSGWKTATRFVPDREEDEAVRARLYEKRLTLMGAWHSHHTLRLQTPSAIDDQTVWQLLADTGWDRFYSFITTIQPPSAERRGGVGVRGWVYESSGSRREVVLRVIPGDSPIRLEATAAGTEPSAEASAASPAPVGNEPLGDADTADGPEDAEPGRAAGPVMPGDTDPHPSLLMPEPSLRGLVSGAAAVAEYRRIQAGASELIPSVRCRRCGHSDDRGLRRMSGGRSLRRST